MNARTDLPPDLPAESLPALPALDAIRALRPQVRDQLQQRITEVAQAQAAVYGASAQVHYERRYRCW